MAYSAGTEKPTIRETELSELTMGSLWAILLHCAELSLADGIPELERMEHRFLLALESAAKQTGSARTSAFLTVSELLGKVLLGLPENPWEGAVFRFSEEPQILITMLSKKMQQVTNRLRHPTIRTRIQDTVYAALRLSSAAGGEGTKPLTIHVRVPTSGISAACISGVGEAGGDRHTFLMDTKETRAIFIEAIRQHVNRWREQVRAVCELLSFVS